jgi:hypothetical protein
MLKIELAAELSAAALAECDDREFLRAIRWRRSAPAELVQVARQGAGAGFAQALLGVVPFRNDLANGENAAALQILWSCEAGPHSPRTERLIKQFKAGQKAGTREAGPRSAGGRKRSPAAGKAASDLVRTWLEAAPEQAVLSPFEVLLWGEWLPRMAHELEPQLLWSLWRTLLTAVVGLTGGDAVDAPESEAPDLRLMRRGELPWQAGLFFSEIKGADKLRARGAEFLLDELEARTDRLGTPRAGLLPRLALWLAPFARALQSAGDAGVALWKDPEAVNLFQNLVERVAPLCRADGRMALSQVSPDDPRSFLEQVFRISGWVEAEAALNCLLPRLKTGGRNAGSRDAGEADAELFVAPTIQSDAARWACLRTNWMADGDLIVVLHAGAAPQIELAAHGRPLLSGLWKSELMLDGKSFPVQGAWDCVCWQSDEDADYLELQLFVPGMWRIERQVMLSRTGRFAVLADSVAELKPGRVDYSIQIPVARGVEMVRDEVTREFHLQRPGVAARVFPLALPQDRVQSSAGEFVSQPSAADSDAGAELVLRQAVQGTGLYAPLVFDWDPQRRKIAAQWRSLTVTEDHRIVGPDHAAGHRLRIGNRHLLIYRSLVSTTEARSVLGHQTRYETVIGAVDFDGDIEPILMVE